MQHFPQVIRSKAPAPLNSRTPGVPYYLIFFLYIAYAIYFYFSVVVSYLSSSDLNAPRILADAITYESICVAEANFLDFASLRDIGPCISLRIFSYSSGLVSIFNAFLIILSTIWVARTYERHWKPVMTLVIINPITFLSIFGPNKEVFGLVTFATLAVYIRSRSLYPLVICLISSLFTRIPTFAVVVAYCLLLATTLPKPGILNRSGIVRYYLIISAILLFATLIAAAFGSQLQSQLLGDFNRAEDVSQSTSISLAIDSLSRYGLFAAVYILRLLFNIYSGMIGLIILISGATPEYYTVGVSGSSILFFILTLYIIIKKLPADLKANSVTWNMIVFMVIFTAFLSVSPVIQHRYFYPIYVFLVIFSVPNKNEGAISEIPGAEHGRSLLTAGS